MKHIYYVIIGLLIVLANTACDKTLKIDTPTFDVMPVGYRSMQNDTFVYRLADTVRYAFSGYAANIGYYNGTPGFSYDYKDRTQAAGKPVLTFTSNATNGTQTGTLQLLATNVLPNYDSATIVNANWKDITNRAKLSVGSGAVTTDTIQLADLVSGLSDSVVLAFKYTGTTGTAQRTWTITNWNVVNMIPAEGVLPARNYILSSLSSDASFWKVTPPINGSTAVWSTTTTQLRVVGGEATAPNNTSWIVSKPLYLSRVQPDLVSQVVRNVNSTMLVGNYFPSPLKPYNVAGTYKTTFAYSNNTADETKGGTKSFFIKMIP